MGLEFAAGNNIGIGASIGNESDHASCARSRCAGAAARCVKQPSSFRSQETDPGG